MFDEDNPPITLKIDLDNYKNPCCPKCGKLLHIITSNVSKCSCPPYYRFFCNQCGWHGWERLEHSDKYEEMMKDCEGFKFRPGHPLITNDAWIINLMTMRNDE
jgi:predicted amidophosphoribosyltransferase